jgi:hypothetical protein
VRAKNGANHRAERQAWKKASASGPKGRFMVRHSCGLNCSGHAAEPNIGPYMPLWVIEVELAQLEAVGGEAPHRGQELAFDSTRSQRTSRSGNSRRLSAARVWAARSNFGPPSR